MRWAQRTVAIGLVLDVTERRGLERTLVVRSSVTEALSRWRSLDPGAVELLRAIATSMGFWLGVLWVFDGGVFVPRAIWHQPSPSLESLAASIRDWTPGLGSPTIGTAYATGTTAFSTDVLASASPERAAALRVAGITGAVAIPAVYEGETLAVLAFVASEPLDDRDQWERAFHGIGLEVGYFLSRHRGELAAPILSDREIEILQLAARGGSTDAISATLQLSPATIKRHFERAYDRLGVSNRAEAVAEAMRRGLIR